MATKLLSFRVTNFRSITDSGEITTDDCTCLVGTNEAGKTNLLLALWKLNPANDEPIIPLSDYPRKSFVDYEGTKGGETFIMAEFELDNALVTELAEELECDRELLRIAQVGRCYNGVRTVGFPYSSMSSYSKQKIEEIFQAFDSDYKSDELFPKNEEINDELLKTVAQVKASMPDGEELTGDDIVTLIAQVDNLIVVKYPRKQNLKAFLEDNLKNPLEKVGKVLANKGVVITPEVRTKVVKNLPKFVYYSDYGNLDSEIYLPHVLENFDRDDLGERERAKARSLKVLFEFVRLEPKEILELGKEAGPTKVITVNTYQGTSTTSIEEPTEQDIDSEKEKKKKREVLLQSASTKLTQDFRSWWKQGEYRFRFQADGSHFRIWVSDDKRPEEIELEGRSKGLQWFFSFFLVFLVESKDSHSNCILLLDEPGLSLHPVAQQDLIAFFHTLSHENQLIYTTHSPFLVSPNDLGNIKALYVDDTGRSVVSSDLRANVKIAEKSIYPIHAAIGLTVSDTLLLGSQPVLVEGISDQVYLQQIKNYLLSVRKFRNSKELVFIPTGGVKGMSPVIKILSGRENTLPFVIMDADSAGKSKEKQLHGDLYKDEPKKVIMVDTFISLTNAEIEDFIPGDQLARIFSKMFRGKKTDDFDFLYAKGQAIVPQMEQFARDNEYTLELGWKVDMAKEYTKVFDRLLSSIPAEYAESWEKLFAAITD